MTKLKKVIEGLKHCTYENILSTENVCNTCPYFTDVEDDCITQIQFDTLELLKEQEPVKPIDETCWNYTYGRCGHCGIPLPALEGLHSKFCWMCGKAVKWDDAV